MRRKFRYLVDNKEMKRKDFENELKRYCQKVVRTDYCGCIGIDVCDVDESYFNRCMRDINKGIVVIMFDQFHIPSTGVQFKREVVMK